MAVVQLLWVSTDRAEYLLRKYPDPCINVKDKFHLSRRRRTLQRLLAPHTFSFPDPKKRSSQRHLTLCSRTSLSQYAKCKKGVSIILLRPQDLSRSGAKSARLSQGPCKWTCADICISFESCSLLESAIFPAAGMRSPSLMDSMLRCRDWKGL